jgi:N-acetylglucosamine-6-sulfatase
MSVLFGCLLIGGLLTPKPESASFCFLPPPVLGTPVKTGCTIELDWPNIDGAMDYVITYSELGSSDPIFVYSPTSDVVLEGLEASTTYRISVRARCFSFWWGAPTNVKVKTLPNSYPTERIADDIARFQAVLRWHGPCAAKSFTVRYKASTDPSWTTFAGLTTDSLLITGLEPATTYQFQVKSFFAGVGTPYSPTSSFMTLERPKPSMVFVFVDDGRIDQYSFNGGPEWLNTPNIERIANEGVNFSVSCAVTPLCGPSRASIYTGVHPSKHGSKSNGELFDFDLPMVQQILTDSGYYTGFIGKWGNGFGSPLGFSWYVISEGDDYIDPSYEYNGMDTTFPGNVMDVYPQLTTDFLATVPDGQPFALFLFHRAPHDVAIPREVDDTIYMGFDPEIPPNFQKYYDDYPSYIYNTSFLWKLNEAETKERMITEYECISGVDYNVGLIWNWLDSLDKTDSTLFIYSSDNGYMEGEHKLAKKGFIYDESFRVPLFVRYPNWFEPNTVVSDEIASILDIPYTMLELAGIDAANFDFEGLSLRALANDEVDRKSILFQLGNNGVIPGARGVRTLNETYLFTFCTDSVEELFDLTIDPQQDTNRLFYPEYAALLDSMRLLTAELRLQYNDTINPTSVVCSLRNIYEDPRLANLLDEGNNALNDLQVNLWPSPASQFVHVELSGIKEDDPLELLVLDAGGRLIYTDFIAPDASHMQINCQTWPAGAYQLIIMGLGDYRIRQFVVTH